MDLLNKLADVLMNHICRKCGFKCDIVYRTNEKEKDGIFYCEKCLKKHEPDLYKSLDKHEKGLNNLIKSIL